jgi:hypothetical protein
VSIRAPISPGFRNETDGIDCGDPFFWVQGETVEACMSSNSIEFDGIKFRDILLGYNLSSQDSKPETKIINNPLCIFR